MASNRVGPCQIDGCEKVSALARGMCHMHYRRFRVHGDPHAVWVMRKPCMVDGCDTQSRAKGYCTKHYQAWRSHGDPEYKAPTNLESGLVAHGTPHGYNYYKCRCELCLAWHRPYSRSKIIESYGITVADYERMNAEQGGVCAICGQAETNGRSLAVDHCHATGRVRGLLCGTCNRGIGLLKDDADRVMSAAIYLYQHVDVLREAAT